MDVVDILPGQGWEHEVRTALRNCEKVLVCLSATSVGMRGYVQREIKLAIELAEEQPEGQLYLIPVKLDSCTVPQRLSMWRWVDVSDDDGYGRLLAALQV